MKPRFDPYWLDLWIDAQMEYLLVTEYGDYSPWDEQPAPVCPRCADVGYTSVRNGCDDFPCKACGDSGEVTF